jgi:hypothetical protein
MNENTNSFNLEITCGYTYTQAAAIFYNDYLPELMEMHTPNSVLMAVAERRDLYMVLCRLSEEGLPSTFIKTELPASVYV